MLFFFELFFHPMRKTQDALNSKKGYSF